MRGRAHSALYENEAAINDFTKAAQLRPHDPAAFLERGQAYLSEKDCLAAMADGSAVVAIDPSLASRLQPPGHGSSRSGPSSKGPRGFYSRGSVGAERRQLFQHGATYQRLGGNELVIADFTQVIVFQPSLAQGYYARAEAERAAKDLRARKRITYRRGSWMGAELAHS